MTQTATKKPIDRALELFSDAKGPTGADNWYSARCPAHNDKNPSFSFKAAGDEQNEDGEGVVFMCHAGCSRQAILDALNLDEKDLHFRSGSIARSGSPTKRTPPITAFDLAADKLIHPNELLATWGIADGEAPQKSKSGSLYNKKGVIIPYYTEEGKPYERYRLRTALIAKEGSTWNANSEAPLIPYGINRLEEARKKRSLTIVEGESDCWTLWHYGFPALGMPGVSNFKGLQLAHLKDIDQVYIIQEPDAAGQDFPANLKKHLDKIGYAGKVYAIELTEFEGSKDPNDLHKKLAEKHGNLKAFKPTLEKAISRARPLFIPGKEPEKPTIFTLQDLMKKHLKPPKWVIPELLPEGLFLLTGKPKLGKSWLGFDMALGIAWGGYVMGKIKVEQGEVLYLALEDNERRIQKRMGILLREEQAPAGLNMVLDWPRVDKGGAELLEEWVKEHPQVRIVIVDTWTKLSPRITNKQQSLYETQYDALVPLKAIADKYAISIVAIHHNRKMGADDVVDEISGSTGLTGSVDGFWILKRERGQTDAVLHVIGRDIEEEQALAINFDASEARWKLEGNAEDFAKTKERQAIINLLRAHSNGLTAKEIAEELNKNLFTIRNLLSSLRDEEKIDLTKYTYTLKRSEHSESSESSYHSEHSEVVNSSPQNGFKPHYDNSKPHYAGAGTVVRFDTGSNGLVEPIHNGHQTNLTTLTTLTSTLSEEEQKERDAMKLQEYQVQEATRKAPTPDDVSSYPQDVRLWYQARRLKLPRDKCLRNCENRFYLPWFKDGEWVELCALCYPGLQVTNGRECQVQS